MNSIPKLLGAIYCLLVSIVSVSAQPSISSFSPSNGPVGTVVTITGANFSATPSDNIVLFGTTRAAVTASTTTSLTVTVPSSAFFQPISVSVNNLTASSSQPFRLVFGGDNKPFYTSSFRTGKIRSITEPVRAADLDGDGYADLVSINTSTNRVLVLKNGNNVSSLSNPHAIDSFVVSEMATPAPPGGFAIGDLNGDGKPELVVNSYISGNATTSIYPNNSTSGNISFNARIDLPIITGVGYTQIAIADMDNDGKPDIVVSPSLTNPTNKLIVFKNSSTGSTISFASKTEFGYPYNGSVVKLADLDDDGKTDVILTGGESRMIVLRNTTSSGTLSFASALAFNTPVQSWYMDAGDLDGDGKTDIAIALNNGGNYVSVFRNTSSAGTIAFDTRKDLPAGNLPNDIVINDFDGDGKADLGVVNVLESNFSVYKNNSTTGNMSFADRVDYPAIINCRYVMAVDLNGDGKPEPVISAAGGMTVLRNRAGEPTILSMTPSPVDDNDTLRISGRGFTGVTDVTLGGTSTAFSLVSDSLIKIVGMVGKTNDKTEITTPLGKDSSRALRRIGYPRIKSVSTTIGWNGASIIINGAAFTHVNNVYFGNIAAKSVTVITDTTIFARVDSGSRPGYIRVVGRYDADSIAGFTYINPPKINAITPTSAASGQTVTITGSFFTRTNQVYFNNIPAASFRMLNDSTVTAIPASGESGFVYVVAPTGYDSIPGFTYIPQRSLVNSFSGPNPFKAGDTIVIKGQKMLALQGVLLGGSSNLSFTVLTDTTLRVVLGNVNSGYITLISSGGRDSLAGFNFLSRPIIHSFSPISGKPGTTVTIKGKAFNNTTSANMVFFGPAKATVTAATDSTLSVTVPSGAGLSTISVIANGLSSRSSQAFTPLFTADPLFGFSDHSFEKLTDSIPGFTPKKSMMPDIDGDGKPDLVIMNAATGSIHIYRNTSVNAIPSFAAKTELLAATNLTDMTIADFDNNGKPDIVVNRRGVLLPIDTAFLFNNQSSSGNISFAEKIKIVGAQQTNILVADDWDADGRIDLAHLGGESNAYSAAYRNKMIGTDISFAKGSTLIGTGAYTGLASRDMDGDGRQDIALVNGPQKMITVGKNITVIGGPIAIPVGTTKNFASRNIATTNAKRAAIEDIDGDGKPDLVLSNYDDNTISVYRNTTAAGVDSLYFSSPVSYATGINPLDITIADFNGDGKADIAVTNTGSASFSLFRNQSTNGTISFAAKKDYATTAKPVSISSGDLNGDGKPDILLADSVSGKSSVFINHFDEPKLLSFAPKHVFHSNDTIILKGYNFSAINAVTLGGSTVKIFGVLNDSTIYLIPGKANSGSIRISSIGGSDSLPGFLINIVPLVKSFSPQTGPVGTTVTIKGTDFGNTVTDNTVYFGAVKAEIKTANDSVLLVTVPSGSTYEPITVTSNNLTGYSAKPFIPTFSHGSNGFRPRSFTAQLELPIEGYSRSAAIGDLNGDGRPDIAIAVNDTKTIRISRNIGKKDSLAFQLAGSYETDITPDVVKFADMDGDGKLDMLASSIDSAKIVFYRNTSSTDSISFDSKQILATSGMGTVEFVIADYDGDGKPDLARVHAGSNLSFYRNISTRGAISLIWSGEVSLNYGNPWALAGADMDKDGKTDLVIATRGQNKLLLIRNTGKTDTIAFQAPTVIAAPSWPGAIRLGDIDGDDKPEVMVTSYDSNTVSVFRNTSLAGAITMDTNNYVYPVGHYPETTILTDFDGDGKADVGVANLNDASFSILKNTSNNNLGLAQGVDYRLPGIPNAGIRGIASGDLDGDGFPDIIATGGLINKKVTIFRNALRQPLIDTYSPSEVNAGNTIAIKGKNFSGVSDVLFAETKASSFTVINDSTISAVTPVTNSGYLIVKNMYGVDSVLFAFAGMQVDSISPLYGPPGTKVSIYGKNFDNSSNAIVQFGAVGVTVKPVNSQLIQVIAPNAATYAPVAVIAKSQVAYGPYPFSIASNPLGKPVVLDAAVSVNNGESMSTATQPQDLNGDGKSELIAYDYYSGNIAMIKNASSGDTVSIELDSKLPVSVSSIFTSGDLDGDGKADIVSANIDNASLVAFKNTGTADSISFGPKLVFGRYSDNGEVPFKLFIRDIDGDNRPDVLVEANGRSYFTIYRNTTLAGGHIAFADPVRIPTASASSTVRAIAVGNLNADRKPDIVVGTSDNTVSIFKNNSVPGKIAFAVSNTITTRMYPSVIVIADLDADNKPEISVSFMTDTVIAVFKNQTKDSIAFANPIELATPGSSVDIAVSDLSGDGKADIIASFFSKPFVLYRNISAGGNLSFEANSLANVYNPGTFTVADLTGDGKQDIAYSASGITYVHPNKTDAIALYSFSPQKAGFGNVVTLKGKGFKKVKFVRFGDKPASSFQIISDSVITAKVNNGNSGNVSVSETVAKDSLPGFIFALPEFKVTADKPLVFGSQPGAASRPQSYVVTGKYLQDALRIIAPGNFQVSLKPDAGFGQTLSIDHKDGVIDSTFIYVIYKSDSAGTNKDSIRHTTPYADSTRLLLVDGTSRCDAVLNSIAAIKDISSATTLCFRDSLVLSANSNFGFYSWSNGDTTKSITLSKSANVTLQVGNNKACMSLPSVIVTTIADTNPIPSLAVIGDSTLASTTAPNYRWYLNNQLISGASGNTLTVKKVGLYVVETSNDKICWDPSGVLSIVTLATPLVNDSVTIRAYPNPSTNGTFTVVGVLQHPANVTARVTVVDVNGVVLLQTSRFLFFGKEIKIPITLAYKGTVFVKLDINGDVKTQTVILQ